MGPAMGRSGPSGGSCEALEEPPTAAWEEQGGRQRARSCEPPLYRHPSAARSQDTRRYPDLPQPDPVEYSYYAPPANIYCSTPYLNDTIQECRARSRSELKLDVGPCPSSAPFDGYYKGSEYRDGGAKSKTTLKDRIGLFERYREPVRTKYLERKSAKEIITEHLKRRPDYRITAAKSESQRKDKESKLRAVNVSPPIKQAETLTRRDEFQGRQSTPSTYLKKPSDFMSTRSKSFEEAGTEVGGSLRFNRSNSQSFLMPSGDGIARTAALSSSEPDGRKTTAVAPVNFLKRPDQIRLPPIKLERRKIDAGFNRAETEDSKPEFSGLKRTWKVPGKLFKNPEDVPVLRVSGGRNFERAGKITDESNEKNTLFIDEGLQKCEAPYERDKRGAHHPSAIGRYNDSEGRVATNFVIDDCRKTVGSEKYTVRGWRPEGTEPTNAAKPSSFARPTYDGMAFSKKYYEFSEKGWGSTPKHAGATETRSNANTESGGHKGSSLNREMTSRSFGRDEFKETKTETKWLLSETSSTTLVEHRARVHSPPYDDPTGPDTVPVSDGPKISAEESSGNIEESDFVRDSVNTFVKNEKKESSEKEMSRSEYDEKRKVESSSGSVSEGLEYARSSYGRLETVTTRTTVNDENARQPWEGKKWNKAMGHANGQTRSKQRGYNNESDQTESSSTKEEQRTIITRSIGVQSSFDTNEPLFEPSSRQNEYDLKRAQNTDTESRTAENGCRLETCDRPESSALNGYDCSVEEEKIKEPTDVQSSILQEQHPNERWIGSLSQSRSEDLRETDRNVSASETETGPDSEHGISSCSTRNEKISVETGDKRTNLTNNSRFEYKSHYLSSDIDEKKLNQNSEASREIGTGEFDLGPREYVPRDRVEPANDGFQKNANFETNGYIESSSRGKIDTFRYEESEKQLKNLMINELKTERRFGNSAPFQTSALSSSRESNTEFEIGFATVHGPSSSGCYSSGVEVDLNIDLSLKDETFSKLSEETVFKKSDSSTGAEGIVGDEKEDDRIGADSHPEKLSSFNEERTGEVDTSGGFKGSDCVHSIYKSGANNIEFTENCTDGHKNISSILKDTTKDSHLMSTTYHTADCELGIGDKLSSQREPGRVPPQSRTEKKVDEYEIIRASNKVDSISRESWDSIYGDAKHRKEDLNPRRTADDHFVKSEDIRSQGGGVDTNCAKHTEEKASKRTLRDKTSFSKSDTPLDSRFEVISDLTSSEIKEEIFESFSTQEIVKETYLTDDSSERVVTTVETRSSGTSSPYDNVRSSSGLKSEAGKSEIRFVSLQSVLGEAGAGSEGAACRRNANPTPAGFYDNDREEEPETFEGIRFKVMTLLTGGHPTSEQREGRNGTLEGNGRGLGRTQQSSQISGGSSPGTAIPGGSNGGSAPFPPPPPPMAPAGAIPSVRIPTEIGPAKKFTEPPAAIQNAMMTKDKKPFTYTPGGLDLAEIRSPRMARRINRNAHTEDSCTPPQQKPSPLAQQPQQPLPPAVVAAMQPQIAIPVFPPGAALAGPSVPPPPPPPPPVHATTPSAGPPLPPPPPLPSPGVIPPPPPPMQDQFSPIKAPPQAKPDFVSDIQKHPPLRQVNQAMPPRPDFVSEIPNHAPLRPVHFGARYIPQESTPPISNQVQLKPIIPKAHNITTPQESPLSKPMANLQISHPPSLENDQAPIQQEQALGSNKNIQESHSPRYQPLYIPPVEVSSPTPMTPKQTPPSPATLNKSPAPWMSTQKQVQKEIPPWVSRENQLKEETQREEKLLREEKPSPAPAQGHTRIIPIQVEGTENSNQHVQKVQTQQKQSTVSVKQESSQAQSRTRIIPIQIEGANDNRQNHQVQRQASLPAQSRGPTFSPNRFNPSPAPFPNSPVPGDMGEGRPRQFQTQQSWTQGNNTPIQSRSFRVLQKITGSDEHPQGILPPGQAFLMNRVFPRQEEIPAHQYLGGDMSPRSPQNMPPGQDNSGRPGESEY